MGMRFLTRGARSPTQSPPATRGTEHPIPAGGTRVPSPLTGLQTLTNQLCFQAPLPTWVFTPFKIQTVIKCRRHTTSERANMTLERSEAASLNLHKNQPTARRPPEDWRTRPIGPYTGGNSRWRPPRHTRPRPAQQFPSRLGVSAPVALNPGSAGRFGRDAAGRPASCSQRLGRRPRVLRLAVETRWLLSGLGPSLGPAADRGRRKRRSPAGLCASGS